MAPTATMTGVLSVHEETIRLFLHVVAATIWVGGQLTLGALVPVLRAAGADVPRLAARRFGVIAWSAFVVLIGTGVWNIVDVQDENHGDYRNTLTVKLIVVAASGLTAWLHQRATTARGRGIFGGLTALTALGALFLGLLLVTH